MYLCPKCDASIQATQKLYWSLNRHSGALELSLATHAYDPRGGNDLTIPGADLTYDWVLYCENDHELGTFDGTPDDLADYLRKTFGTLYGTAS